MSGIFSFIDHFLILLQCYVRSTKFALPRLLDALKKGNDPDRMKGALYMLWNKGIATCALTGIHCLFTSNSSIFNVSSGPDSYGQYLLSLLDCQHEEKVKYSRHLVWVFSTHCITLSHLSRIWWATWPMTAYFILTRKRFPPLPVSSRSLEWRTP